MGAMDLKATEDRKLLRARASRLAAPIRNEAESERYIDVVIFLISGESYALPTDRIGSVTPCMNLCPIPGTPDHILGIANVSGELLPIVDIGPRFGLSRGEPRKESRIIVLENSAMKFGIFAETVSGSRSVGTSELKPPLSNGQGPSSYILNIMSDGTMLMNADAMLADISLEVNDQ